MKNLSGSASMSVSVCVSALPICTALYNMRITTFELGQWS